MENHASGASGCSRCFCESHITPPLLLLLLLLLLQSLHNTTYYHLTDSVTPHHSIRHFYGKCSLSVLWCDDDALNLTYQPSHKPIYYRCETVVAKGYKVWRIYHEGSSKRHLFEYHLSVGWSVWGFFPRVLGVSLVVVTAIFPIPLSIFTLPAFPFQLLIFLSHFSDLWETYIVC